jgi:ketosteroid isomerase-like protein
MKHSMITKYLALVILLITSFTAAAQRPTNVAVKRGIDSVNRLLDHAVVSKNIAVLQKHYGDDFVFTHGTGQVDSKRSWIKNVADTSVRFLSREHDSTEVELHKDIAIISGKLTVERQTGAAKTMYALRYVRVFAQREKIWQMISHRTTAEWHY